MRIKRRKNASLNLVIEMSISTYDEQHSAHQLPSAARGEKCFKRSFFFAATPGFPNEKPLPSESTKICRHRHLACTLAFGIVVVVVVVAPPCRDALLRMTGFVNGARKKASPNSTAAQLKMMCAPINYETSHKRN